MKRNKKKKQKLELRRNVIRRLVDIRSDELEQVNGGLAAAGTNTRCSDR